MPHSFLATLSISYGSQAAQDHQGTQLISHKTGLGEKVLETEPRTLMHGKQPSH